MTDMRMPSQPVRHMSAKDRNWPDFAGEARPSSTPSTTGTLS